MAMRRTKAQTVDDYIAAQPNSVRAILRRIRTTIRKAAPQAEESISYAIPAFKLNGALVYFAAFQSHIGLYPITKVVKEQLGKELTPYQAGKGTLRFPLEGRIPYGLITKVVKLRMKENRERAAKKK